MQKLSSFIFLLALAHGYGQSPATKTATPAKSAVGRTMAPLQNTLLWEISGKDLTHPSYLFGTMHLICSDDAHLSDSLRYCIETTKQVYFEIDMDNLVEMMGALKYMNMNNNTKLSDLLTPEEYERVKNYFSKNRQMLPFSTMERFKPYLVEALVEESKFPCAEKDGMEQVIMKEAKKDGKVINGLETVAFQAGIFDSIPYKRQAKELLKAIDSAGNEKDSSDVQLLDLYRRQDVNKMQEMTADEEGMSDYIDLLLYNRNANWVRKMPAIMQEKATLFAVGAGHLGGEKGVINLLRKAGYTLRPVKHRPGLETITN